MATYNNTHIARLAQLVECTTVNRKATGSKPVLSVGSLAYKIFLLIPYTKRGVAQRKRDGPITRRS